MNDEEYMEIAYQEAMLTFILGMAFWLSGIFYLIGEFVFFK